MDQTITASKVVTGKAQDIIIMADKTAHHKDDLEAQLLKDALDILPGPGSELQEAWEDLLIATTPVPDLLDLTVGHEEYAAFTNGYEEPSPAQSPHRKPKRKRSGKKRNGGSRMGLIRLPHYKRKPHN